MGSRSKKKKKKKPKPSPAKNFFAKMKKAFGDSLSHPLVDTTPRPPRRLVSWHIGMLPTDDPLVLSAKVEGLKSSFRAIRLLIMPTGVVLDGLKKNGQPVIDHLGRPIDAEFFRQCVTPPALLGEHGDKMSELRLKDNAVYVEANNDDVLEARVTVDRDARPKGRVAVSLLGYTEEVK